LRKEQIADIKNELINLLPKIIKTIIAFLFFHTLFGVCVARCSPNSDLCCAQNSLVTANQSILVQAVEVCFKNL